MSYFPSQRSHICPHMTLSSLLSDILYDNMPQTFPGTQTQYIQIYEAFPWTNRRPKVVPGAILLNTHVTQGETHGLSSNTWHHLPSVCSTKKNSVPQVVPPHPALYTQTSSSASAARKQPGYQNHTAPATPLAPP